MLSFGELYENREHKLIEESCKVQVVKIIPVVVFIVWESKNAHIVKGKSNVLLYTFLVNLCWSQSWGLFPTDVTGSH